MAKETLLGKFSILSLSDGIMADYLPVGCLTSNGISRSMEMTDGTLTKCDPDPEPIPGKRSYTIPFDAVAIDNDTAHASLLKVEELFEAGAPIYWKNTITKTEGVPIIRYGRAYLTEFNQEAPVDGEITFSGTLNGIGAVSKTDLILP